MLRQIVAYLFIGIAFAQDCSSLTSLGHYTGDCPFNLGMPSCSYIQQNMNQICTNVISDGITVNGPACNLNGEGCIYSPNMAEISEYFCCTLVSPSATPTPSVTPPPTPTPSITPPPTPTPSITPTISKTPSLTRTPMYVYDSQTDFNGFQGNKGWTYNYYKESNYGPLPVLGNAEGSTAWMYSQSCAGFITATTMMPNDGINCNTPSCGTVRPAIKWSNPFPPSDTSYFLVTLSLRHYENGGQGEQIWVNINGGSAVYSPVITYASGTLTWSSYANINTFELIVQPLNGCDYAKVNYRITIMSVPITPSPTSTASRTSSASASRSASPSSSSSASASSSASSIPDSSSSTGSSTICTSLTETITCSGSSLSLILLSISRSLTIIESPNVIFETSTAIFEIPYPGKNSASISLSSS